MTVVDHATGEVVDRLTATEARSLTDRIRTSLSVAYDGLIAAWRGRADLALGYDSWDAYCAGEFAEGRMVRLPREQRVEIVTEMSAAGMSSRAIGSGLGVDKDTVNDDLKSGGGNPPPASVGGLDGKSYPRPALVPPAPAPPPKTPRPRRRPPLPDAFFDAVFDLNKNIERVQRLTEDDRFPRNAEQVAAKHRGDLLRAHEALAGVLALLQTPGA